MNLDEFNTLIEAIYSAGSDPEQWPDALRLLTNAFSGAAAAIHVGATDCSGFTFGTTYNVCPEALAEYQEHYYAINPLNAALARTPGGVVVPDHALVPRHEMRSSEFHNDYGRRFQLEGSATMVLDKNKRATSCLGVVRGFNSNEFEPAELAELKLLMPHVYRAIHLHKQLVQVQHERDAGLAALDKLETAVFLLKAGGLMAHCNTAAETLLRTRDGLTTRGEKIKATNTAAARELDRLIHEATTSTAGRGGFMKLPRQSDLPPLSARVLPIVSKEDFFRTPQIRAALFVSNPNERSQSGVEHIAAMHGLTETESRLATALIQGNSLQEAADLMQIAKGTARKHLAHIMAKTGTNRQAELIALILARRLPLR